MSLLALSYTRFVATVLHVLLTPGQCVLCRIAFDGLDPQDLDGEERDLALQIFGDVDVIAPHVRATLALLAGRGSGKSYLLALRLLHLGLTLPMRLSPGEHAYGLIVAPDTRLGRIPFRYLVGAIESVPSISRLVTAETADSITLQRPDGITITFEVLPATSGGSALRGRTVFGAVIDEGVLPARQRLPRQRRRRLRRDHAATATGRPGHDWVDTVDADRFALGTVVQEPLGYSGDGHLSAGPTLLLRDDEHTRAMVERAYAQDPAKAAREHGADPMAAGASDFFDPVSISNALVEDCPLVLQPLAFAVSTCGLDTGFRRDPSAAVVVRQAADGVFDVAEVFEVRAPKGETLKPTETIAAMLERARWHKCGRIVADMHYIESVREQAVSFSLTPAPSDPAFAYVATRDLLREGRLRIGVCHARLIQQLHETIGRPTSGGRLQISNPRRGGSHGDLVSALVLAVWSAVSNQMAVPVVEAIHGNNRGYELVRDGIYGRNPFHRVYSGPGATHDFETKQPLPRLTTADKLRGF